MKSTNIFIPNLVGAKEFVNITSKYTDFKMNLKSDNYIIDAHSIIGILSLDLSKTIILETESNVPTEFFTEIHQFIEE